MKRGYILGALILNSILSLGQVQIEWQNSLGGIGTDNPRSVYPTSDGGCAVAGWSFSPVSGDKSENNVGESDYWIVKLDESGNIEWENTIGGNFEDQPYSIKQTLDGGYIISGDSFSNASGDKSESSVLSDYWIIKLDSNGIIEWENTINADNLDSNPRVELTNDGGYIVAGTSQSGVFGDKTDPSNGENDYWVIKLDSIGNIVWQNSIGGSGDEFLADLSSTSDGGYILGGTSTSDISGDKTENSRGSSDYWVVKIDSNGSILWDKTLGGNNLDQLASVFETSDGGFILGGTSSSDSSGEKSEDNIGVNDYWIIKTDDEGSVIWENTIGGHSGEESGYTIPLSIGGYLVHGSSLSGISGDKDEENIGSFDFWIVQLDDNGVIINQDTVGGDLGEFTFNIQLSTSESGAFIIGNSSSDISGDKTDPGNGQNDYWVIKLSEGLLGLASLESNNQEKFLYPNPTENLFTITTPLTEINTLTIIGADGKVVLEKKLFLTDTIDVSNLINGIYVVVIDSTEGTKTQKLVKI